MTYTDTDWDLPHPACTGPCGNLADECTCPPKSAIVPQSEPYDDWDDFAEPCRWRGCTADAQTRGFCDAHYDTL